MTESQPSEASPDLGVFFDLRNPSGWRRDWAAHYGRSLDLAEEAERLGSASAWVTEHHLFADGYIPQPLTFLAALGARTRTMRLGTAVLVAALRHPRHVAEEAAIVDLISGGRLELGLGTGYAAAEFEAFGEDLAGRRDRTDSMLRAVRDLLWSGELLPPPVQSRVPLWLGYQGPQGARRTGRLGVGLLSTGRDLLPQYLQGLVDGGHDVADARMGGVVNLIVSNDPERAAHRLVPFVHHHRSTYAATRHGTPPFDSTGSPDFGPDELLTTDSSTVDMVVLDVDGAVALLAERAAGLPVRHLYLWASVAGMPDDMVDEHLQLLFGPVARRVSERSSAERTPQACIPAE